MKSVEEIMEEQLQEYRTKFRPVFGNQKHIEIVRATEKLMKLEDKLERYAKEGKDTQLIKDEITYAKRQLLFLFKINNQ